MIIQQNNPAGNYAGLNQISVLLIIVLMATSCTMSRVAIDVLRPPENEADEPLTTCGWMSRINPGKGYVEYYINGSFINKTSHFNDRLANLTFRRVEQYANDLGYMEIKQLNYSERRPTGTFEGPLMTRFLVQRLCRDFDVDFIIALEGFDTDIDVEQSVTYSPGVDRNFGVVSVPMFDGLQTVTMHMYFRIYNKDGEVVHSDQEAAQSIYSTTGDYPAEMHRKMRSADGLLNQAAEEIADLYLNTISPHWKRINRGIYSTGSQELKLAAQMAAVNNWPGASNIWYNLAQSENKKIAKKAAFNMIVASEAAQDYELAIQWANTCITQYKSNKALTYLSDLKDKKRETESISQQFPLAQ